MEEEIKSEFEKSGFDFDEEEAEQVLKQCLAFCINYDLKPSDLVSSWEVYYLNRQLNESRVRNEEMEGFLLHLQYEQKEAVLKEDHNLHSYSSKDIEMILNDEEDESKEGNIRTPTDKSLKFYSEQSDSAMKVNGNGYSADKPSKLVTPFGRRTNKFAVRFSINNLPDTENVDKEDNDETLEDDVIKRVQPHKRCSLTVNEFGPQPGCRFMYDRIEDRFNALDNRIRKYAASLVASGLYEEPVDPTVASQRIAFAVGMICCDGEGHLNDKSIMLQSSVEHAGGRQVRLDLTKLNQFSIFPGQVVGIEGSNPSGHCFIGSNLIDSVPLSDTSDNDLHHGKKLALDPEIQSSDLSDKQKQIFALIASGPFTTTDNLFFEPLTELLAYAGRKLPQLLLLLGPFIDSEHPEIRRGTVDRSFFEIFQMEIIRRLQEYVEYTGSNIRVILVPSLRDAHHDFVFPQPAFEIHPPILKHQLTGLSNPGSFEANQVQVGCCTADVLRQLSSEEISRNPSEGAPIDRMSRIANHILSQRSFYPLYPPAEDMPLDYSLAPEAFHISSIPDILILPSDMKYFIRVLSLGGREGEEEMKCVCINPGRLAKGEGGGTFAELYYNGSPDRMNASIIGI